MKLNIHAVELLAEIIWKRAEWDTGKSWDSIIENLKSVRAASNDETQDDVQFLIELASHRKQATMMNTTTMTPEQCFKLILDGDYGTSPSELIQECFIDPPELPDGCFIAADGRLTDGEYSFSPETYREVLIMEHWKSFTESVLPFTGVTA